MFNVVLKPKQYSIVTVGVLRGESVAMTMCVSVPTLTNEKPIAAGEELILEVEGKAAGAPTRTAASWNDDVATAAKANTKAAKHAAKPKPKACVGLEIDSEV